MMMMAGGVCVTAAEAVVAGRAGCLVSKYILDTVSG